VHFPVDSVERTLDIREAMRLYTAGPVANFDGPGKINAGAPATLRGRQLPQFGLAPPGTAPTFPKRRIFAAGDILCELGLPEGEDLSLIVKPAHEHGLRPLASRRLFNNSDRHDQQTSGTRATWSIRWGYRVFRDSDPSTPHTVGDVPVRRHSAGEWREPDRRGRQTNATMTLVTDGWSLGAFDPET